MFNQYTIWQVGGQEKYVILDTTSQNKQSNKPKNAAFVWQGKAQDEISAAIIAGIVR